VAGDRLYSSSDGNDDSSPDDEIRRKMRGIMPQIPNSKKRLNNNSLTPEKKNKGKMKSLIR